MIFRCYYEQAGGHVHCRMFSGKQDGALGKNGDLTFRIDEFDDFKNSSPFIQFRPDTSRDPRTARVRNAEETILDLHAENERLRAQLTTEV